MRYLQTLRQVPEVAFISEQTKNEYDGRVMRGTGRGGPVLPLGADGFGLERQIWSATRTDVVMVGTIEMRKNIHIVMNAFRLLWSRGHKIRLVLAGRVAVPELPALNAFAAEAGPERFACSRQPTRHRTTSCTAGCPGGFFTRAMLKALVCRPYEAVYCGIPGDRCGASAKHAIIAATWSSPAAICGLWSRLPTRCSRLGMIRRRLNYGGCR